MKLSLQQTPRTVLRQIEERKRQFRKALALAEMTQGQWAAKHEIGASYLSRFLSGREVSAPLTEKVNAFIAKHLPAKVA